MLIFRHVIDPVYPRILQMLQRRALALETFTPGKCLHLFEHSLSHIPHPGIPPLLNQPKNSRCKQLGKDLFLFFRIHVRDSSLKKLRTRHSLPYSIFESSSKITRVVQTQKQTCFYPHIQVQARLIALEQAWRASPDQFPQSVALFSLHTPLWYLHNQSQEVRR
ncbi:MAG: hypothetical protein RIQ41_434 [Candidatus Parcubacteria bacterium]